MSGDPGDYDKVGVYAWKTKRAALEQMAHYEGGIVGRVALWGEVVEHERGYRAEFGKVVSLDYVNVWAFRQKGQNSYKNAESHALDRQTLAMLRELYGLTEDATQAAPKASAAGRPSASQRSSDQKSAGAQATAQRTGKWPP